MKSIHYFRYQEIKKGKIYCEDESVEYYYYLFEFVINVEPKGFISIDKNVNCDKIFGVPNDTNLKVYEVYLYIDEPLAAGIWGGYFDFDGYAWK